MAWYSVLPSHLTVYETWIIRTFIILAAVNILPWVALIVYDLILYISRTVIHEVPLYGGRARGQRRPRVPSLSDPNRRTSFAKMIRRTSVVEESDLGSQARNTGTSASVRRRHEPAVFEEDDSEKR